jgi:hypothetical protein
MVPRLVKALIEKGRFPAEQLQQEMQQQLNARRIGVAFSAIVVLGAMGLWYSAMLAGTDFRPLLYTSLGSFFFVVFAWRTCAALGPDLEHTMTQWVSRVSDVVPKDVRGQIRCFSG